MNDETPTVYNTLFIGTCKGDPDPLPFAELLNHHAEARQRGRLCPDLMHRLYGNGQPHAMKHIKKTS